MRLGQKQLLWAAVTLALLEASSGTAVAQSYPTKSIEMVIPWATGGRTDTMVRMLAPYLEKELGQPVVVVNKTGGGGLVGMTFIKNAPPDGYLISSGGVALSSMQYQRKTDLSLWDFTWFAQVYSTPLVVAVPASSPFKSVTELVEYANANPGKLRHSNSGTGSSTHLASAIMGKRLGFEVTQVPYKGEGPAVVGLSGNEGDFALGLMVAFRPFVEDSRLRILGVAASERDPNLPEVPTLKEQGVPFEYYVFEALHVPNGTPKPVLDKLSVAAKNALSNPELIEKFAAVGLNAAYLDEASFTTWLKGWDADMKTIMQELGLYARD